MEAVHENIDVFVQRELFENLAFCKTVATEWDAARKERHKLVSYEPLHIDSNVRQPTEKQ